MALPLSLPEAHARHSWEIRPPSWTGGAYAASHEVHGIVSAGTPTELLAAIRERMDEWVLPQPPAVREKRVPEPQPDTLRGWKRYGPVNPAMTVTPLE
jgi:hypothetical protein